jgi:hypothetical protein
MGVLIFTSSARAADARIEGQVTDASGLPLKNTEVRVRGETTPGSDFSIRTDKDGRFFHECVGSGKLYRDRFR